MEMEWAFVAAVIAPAAVLVLVIRNIVRMCARTVFAQPYVPTPEEVKACQTHCSLPEAVMELPEGVEKAAIEQAAEQTVYSWMQAVNSRSSVHLKDAAGGLREALAVLSDGQIARGERERFEQPKVHQSVICAIHADRLELVVCVSAQAIHYIASGGQIICGREDLPEQMLWKLVCTDYTVEPVRFSKITQIK